MISLQRIMPFLWFDTQAEEAATFYTSIFPNSKITGISYYSEGCPGPVGSVMTVGFELDGQSFMALNGGPHFKYTEAVSFVVHCKDQAEIDHYWDHLTADDGHPVECGWLKDKYGLPWQIVPADFAEFLKGPNSDKVMKAVMSMKKLDLNRMQAAAAGEG